MEDLKKLKDAFPTPLMEPVVLFHTATIQLFTQFNKLFSTEK